MTVNYSRSVNEKIQIAYQTRKLCYRKDDRAMQASKQERL